MAKGIRTLKRHPRTLLVDLDGTLLDAHLLPAQIEFIRGTLKVIKGHGGYLKAIRAVQGAREELDRPAKDRHPDNVNALRATRAFARTLGLSEIEAGDLLKESMFKVFPTLKRHFYPIPGAREFLEWARNEYELVLATNPVWPMELVQMRLDWAGIDSSWFKLATTSMLMHACKPAPEYFREVLDLIAAQPEECMLIGNEIRMDLPAVSVGIPVYLVGKEARGKRLPPLAHHGTFEQIRTALLQAREDK